VIIFDTNVWVAFFNANDSQHKKAQRAILHSRETIIIPEYVIVETTTVLSVKASKAIANQFLDAIQSNVDVQIMLMNEQRFIGTVELFRIVLDGTLSFVDTHLLWLHQYHPVVTFDQELQQALQDKDGD